MLYVKNKEIAPSTLRARASSQGGCDEHNQLTFFSLWAAHFDRKSRLAGSAGIHIDHSLLWLALLRANRPDQLAYNISAVSLDN